MMICCCLLLIGGMASGGLMTVQSGQAVLLFSNTSVDNNNKNVTLYANGNRKNTLLATWTWKDCSTEVVNLNLNYRGRLGMDINKNIWIWKVDVNDTGTYCINCNKTTTGIEVQLNVSKELTKEEQIQGCLHNTVCMKKYLDSLTGEQILPSLNNLQLDFFKKSFETSYQTTMTLDRKESTEENLMKEFMPLLSTCIYNPVTLAILVIVVFIAVVNVVFIVWICACYRCKKNPCYKRKKITENKQGEETASFLEISQQQKEQFVQTDLELQATAANISVSDVDKPNLSLKWRFSGRTQDSSRKPWLLDLVLNPDDDLIVTDGENNELKKFSLDGTLKSKLVFKTRPNCLALTDGYLAMVTFPHETVLRVIDTRDELSCVTTIPFKSRCAGIGSMKDGRLIIGNRESKSVFLCSRDGKILEEIKTGRSGETLFRKPSYVRVVDNRTIYVSDDRTKEFVIININDDNTFTTNKHQISYPRTSCVVDGMLLVAASNIRLFTLDGNEAGEVTLDGVHYVRGLAFSEGKRLLAITHQSDADEEISVYEVKKH